MSEFAPAQLSHRSPLGVQFTAAPAIAHSSASDSDADPGDSDGAESPRGPSLDRFLPLLSGSEGGITGGSAALGDGTETIRRMERTFDILRPDSDQTIQADNVCALLRELGYRPDAAIVSVKFAELNRRLAKAAAVSGADDGSSVGSAVAADVSDDREMHLHAFMDLLGWQSNEPLGESAAVSSPSALRSSGGARSQAQLPLDSDLQDLQRSLELIALSAPPSVDAIRAATKAAGLHSSHSSSLHSPSSSSLLSVHVLRQRMRVLPLSKRLSDAELSALISEVGVLDAAGMPAPHLDCGSASAATSASDRAAASAASAGFIDLHALVRMLQANRTTTHA